MMTPYLRRIMRTKSSTTARLPPSAGLYMVVQRGEAELMLRTSCAMDLQVWWDAIAEALRGTAVHPHRPGDVVVGAPPGRVTVSNSQRHPR